MIAPVGIRISIWNRVRNCTGLVKSSKIYDLTTHTQLPRFMMPNTSSVIFREVHGFNCNNLKFREAKQLQQDHTAIKWIVAKTILSSR